MSLDQNSYNKGGMVTLVISLVVTFAMMIWVAFFSKGVDLKEVKEKADAAQAPLAQQAEKPVDISGVKDPWMPNDQMVAAGKQLFATNCAMCHGATGHGDGPAGASLNPKPRNLVEGKWKYGGTRLGLMGVLEKGSPGTSMQSYKHMPINQRWALVHFIRSITENKVADNDADVAAKAPALQ